MDDVPEMVERVARAMEPSAFETWDRGYRQSNSFDNRSFLNAERTVKTARRKAAVALTAVREPTLAMANAGRWPGEDDGPVACWRAMIDAALASPPKE